MSVSSSVQPGSFLRPLEQLSPLQGNPLGPNVALEGPSDGTTLALFPEALTFIPGQVLYRVKLGSKRGHKACILRTPF